MVQKKSAARPRNVQPPAGFDRPPAAVKLELEVGAQFIGEILSSRDVQVNRGGGKVETARVIELEENGTGRVLTWWPKPACIADLDRLKAAEGDWVWIYRDQDVAAKTPGFNDRKVYDVAIRHKDTAGTEAPY